MFEEQQKPTFGELPQGLVRDVLDQSMELAGGLHRNLSNLKGEIQNIRLKIGEHNIRNAADLLSPNVPTSCGVDGSYLVERLLATDLAAFAVLAIEGITPPSEKRFWPEPRHVARTYSVTHHESTQQLLRGLMMSHELCFAKDAPHDVVLLDYGIRTPVIYLNNATSNFNQTPSEDLRAGVRSQLPKALDAFLEIASGRRSDKVYVGSPKYSTLRELSSVYGLAVPYDDRTIATLVLRPGEFLGPFPIGSAGETHISVPPSVRESDPDIEETRDNVLAAVDRCQVIYYKPRPYLPAFRLEAAERTCGNSSALGVLLRAIEFQSSAPGVFEPFPLYLADRMVKHLGTAFPAFLQAIVHEMASKYDGDSGEVFLAMHSYRSEGGM